MIIYYHQIKLNEWFSSSVRKPNFNWISASSVVIYVISGTKMSLRGYAVVRNAGGVGPTSKPVSFLWQQWTWSSFVRSNQSSKLFARSPTRYAVCTCPSAARSTNGLHAYSNLYEKRTTNKSTPACWLILTTAHLILSWWQAVRYVVVITRCIPVI